MPRTKTSNPFLKMTHHDLAYAVQRLVRLGKTNVAHIRTLASERMSAIEHLEAKVAALKAAIDVDAIAAAPRKYKARVVKAVKHVAKAAKRKVGRPKGSKTKLKLVKAKKAAKPVVKRSPAAIAAMKIQGRYMGIRRHLTAALQAEASKIAQAEGVKAALKFVEANRAKSAA
jgi:hypothetical protein